MILIALAILGVLSVPLTGGRLSRLSELPLRALWLAPLALAIQVVITVIIKSGSEAVHAEIHVATYALIAVFLVANHRLPGMRVMAAGAFSNAVVIVLNHGVMPAAAAAQRLVGMDLGGGFHNSARVAHPMLLFLGDIIPVPGPLPNVMSVGDLAIFAGMVFLLQTTCRRSRPAAPPAPAAAAAASAPLRYETAAPTAADVVPPPLRLRPAGVAP